MIIWNGFDFSVLVIGKFCNSNLFFFVICSFGNIFRLKFYSDDVFVWKGFYLSYDVVDLWIFCFEILFFVIMLIILRILIIFINMLLVFILVIIIRNILFLKYVLFLLSI